MKKSNTIKIIIGTAIIAVFVFIFVVIEFLESRNELLKSLNNEAENLSKIININFENNFLINNEIESQYLSKLKAIGELLVHRQFPNELSNNNITEIMGNNDIDHISIVDKNGKFLFNSDKTFQNSKINYDFLEQLEPILTGDDRWIDFGNNSGNISNFSNYLIAYSNPQKSQVAFIGIDSKKILDFRKKIGIGKQIQELKNNSDIIYIVLQDKEGIYTASENIQQVSAIESDTFLIDAIKTGKVMTRMTEYNGNKIYEAAKSLKIEDIVFVNRIALSLENVISIQQKSMRRVGLIGIGIFVVFSLFYIVLITRKGFSKLKEEHKIIKSYTDQVLDNMADAVIAIDNQNKIKYFNISASKIFNFNLEDILERDYFELFPDDLLLLHNSKEADLGFINKDIEFINSKNQKKILEISVSIVKSGKAESTLIIAIINDKTEKILLQKQIERKDQLSAMGELAAGVAHEIRNPLNAINIISQRIQYEFTPEEDGEEYKKLITTIRSEVARVNNIIKQFLEFTSPKYLKIETANLNKIIGEVFELYSSEAQLKDIELELISNDDIILKFDIEKIKQVLINLIKNAIEAIEKNGKIIIKMHIDNDLAVIEIIDDGPGITDEIKKKIFNIYFTTKSNGTGLGLSLVHQIINEHNGTIDVFSSLGKGTTFIVKLPIQ